MQASSLRHSAFDPVLKMVRAGVTPFLPGPSGCGKTTIAHQVAEAMDQPFYYTGALESAFQLRGFIDAQGHVVRTPFRDAYEKGGIFLFDELDASVPSAIISVHVALDNGVLDAPDGIIKRHPDFRYIAAANTFGHGATLDYIGRNAMDGATIDRYVFYPLDYDAKLEKKLVSERHPKQKSWVYIVQKSREASRELGIRQIISTRACLQGASLLDQGFSTADVFKMTVAKGMPDDDAFKIWHAVSDNAKEDLKSVAGAARFELDNENLVALIGDAKNVVAELREARQELCATVDKSRRASGWRAAVAQKLLGINLGSGNA